MRDKKMSISVILITTAMLFAGGCGKQAEPVSVEWAETVKEVDTEESLEPTPSSSALPEESMESSEAPDNSENEDDTTEEEGEQDLEYEINSIDDTVMYAIANCTIRPGAGTQYDKVGSLSYAQEVTINGKVEAGEDKLWYVIKTEDGSTQMVSASMLSETKPVAQTSSGNGSGSSSNSGGSTGDAGNSEAASASSGTASTESTPEPAAPASTPAPVHTHNWKEHTVTNQVWVPNIVVVDDYEYRVVGRVDDVAICNCGYTTTSRDDIVEHVKNHDYAGENTQFTIQPGYDIVEEVKVGSHEEDKGHYETQTYVDYYYCECGATM